VTEYLEFPSTTLRQGDIVLAPSVVLLRADEGWPVPEEVPRAPDRLGGRTQALAWKSDEASHTPEVLVETSWSPVLVISHDCHLEKDFNERVNQLIDGGIPEEQAVAEASGDPNLDPFAVVAPLHSYSDFPAHRHAGIRAGERIGYFPLDALPRDGRDYAVDLGRLTTVSVRLLPQSGKVASLGPSSIAELRYKLAECIRSAIWRC